MPEGHFTIPTRVFVTPAQREQLALLLKREQIELPELLTELLASFLDHLPDDTRPDESDIPSVADRTIELERRRAEVRRLRKRMTMYGDDTPKWTAKYVADLEQEIIRLERDENPS